MIEEKFLIAAINIRKNYLKITSNIDFYRKRAERTLEVLDKSLEDIDNIEKAMKGDDRPDSINEMIEVLRRIEEEGNKIQKFVEPLNKEIEKLAIEEQELYRVIVEKHPELSEEQIVESVRQRLNKENL
jgi:cell division protein ZapA (FtsZ GTPase activity inhibitor)